MKRNFMLVLTAVALVLVGLTTTACSTAGSTAPTAQPADSPQPNSGDEADGVG